jgi:hypothetical protein
LLLHCCTKHYFIAPCVPHHAKSCQPESTVLKHSTMELAKGICVRWVRLPVDLQAHVGTFFDSHDAATVRFLARGARFHLRQHALKLKVMGRETLAQWTSFLQARTHLRQLDLHLVVHAGYMEWVPRLCSLVQLRQLESLAIDLAVDVRAVRGTGRSQDALLAWAASKESIEVWFPHLTRLHLHVSPCEEAAMDRLRVALLVYARRCVHEAPRLEHVRLAGLLFPLHSEAPLELDSDELIRLCYDDDANDDVNDDDSDDSETHAYAQLSLHEASALVSALAQQLGAILLDSLAPRVRTLDCTVPIVTLMQRSWPHLQYLETTSWNERTPSHWAVERPETPTEIDTTQMPNLTGLVLADAMYRCHVLGTWPLVTYLQLDSMHVSNVPHVHALFPRLAHVCLGMMHNWKGYGHLRAQKSVYDAAADTWFPCLRDVHVLHDRNSAQARAWRPDDLPDGCLARFEMPVGAGAGVGYGALMLAQSDVHASATRVRRTWLRHALGHAAALFSNDIQDDLC